MKCNLDLWTCVPKIASLGEKAISFFNEGKAEEARENQKYLLIADRDSRKILLIMLIDASQGNDGKTLNSKVWQRVQDQASFLLGQNHRITSRESNADDSFWCPAGAIAFDHYVLSVRGNDATNGCRPANEEQETVHDENEAIAMIIGMAFFPVPNNLSAMKQTVAVNGKLKKIARYFSQTSDPLTGSIHNDDTFKLRLSLFSE